MLLLALCVNGWQLAAAHCEAEALLHAPDLSNHAAINPLSLNWSHGYKQFNGIGYSVRSFASLSEYVDKHNPVLVCAAFLD